MTNLEVALIVAEVITLGALVRIYRKHMIVRHLFIQSSDWCARKIIEVAETACWRIMDDVKQSAKANGTELTDDEARDTVPYVILDAKKAWEAQADHFQATLKRNGISQLGAFDLDVLFWPGILGFKSVPYPPGY